MIDLTGVVASFAVPVTFDHRPPGYIDNAGVSRAAAVESVTARAVILPGGDRGVVLPEGVRSEDVCRVFSPVIVRGAQDPEGYWATRFTWRGRRFEVREVMDRSADGNGKFWRAIAFRVRESEDDER